MYVHSAKQVFKNRTVSEFWADTGTTMRAMYSGLEEWGVSFCKKSCQKKWNNKSIRLHTTYYS